MDDQELLHLKRAHQIESFCERVLNPAKMSSGACFFNRISDPGERQKKDFCCYYEIFDGLDSLNFSNSVKLSEVQINADSAKKLHNKSIAEQRQRCFRKRWLLIQVLCL